MSYKVVIFSTLGGVGKTTVAVNLACQMSQSQKVCLIDADPFAAAWHWSKASKLPVSIELCPLTSSRQCDAWVQELLAMCVDTMVFDLPTSSDLSWMSALRIADLIVVPVQSSSYGLLVAGNMIDLLRTQFRDRLKSLAPVLLIPTLTNQRSSSGQRIEGDLLELGEKVGPAIGARAAFKASADRSEWVEDLPQGRALIWKSFPWQLLFEISYQPRQSKGR